MSIADLSRVERNRCLLLLTAVLLWTPVLPRRLPLCCQVLSLMAPMSRSRDFFSLESVDARSAYPAVLIPGCFSTLPLHASCALEDTASALCSLIRQDLPGLLEVVENILTKTH